MSVTFHPPYEEFVNFITSSPTLREIAEFRLSEAIEERIEYLLDQNGEGVLTPDEKSELEDFLRVEHLMRRAKQVALEKMAGQS